MSTKELEPVLASLHGVRAYRLLQRPDGWGTNIAVFIVACGDEWLIVDTGWDGASGARAWQRAVEDLGLRWEGLRRILVTHGHPDHIGLARALSELSGVPATLHPDVLIDVASNGNAASDDAHRRFLIETGYLNPGDVKCVPNPHAIVGGFPSPSRVESIEGGSVVRLGSLSIEAVFTPGHGRGHLCFMDSERRFMFSGDMVLPGLFPTIPGTQEDEANPLRLYLRSLSTLELSGVEVLVPAHGDIIDDPCSRIAETRRYFEHQLALVRQSLTRGDATAHQLAGRQSFQGRPYERHSAVGQVVVLGEMRAYLQLLEAQGETRSWVEPSGTRVYALA
jgi:glyoxylase-like metal-dependent hydrolase (beta-lactamase superfamily II)